MARRFRGGTGKTEQTDDLLGQIVTGTIDQRTDHEVGRPRRRLKIDNAEVDGRFDDPGHCHAHALDTLRRSVQRGQPGGLVSWRHHPLDG